MLFWWHVRHIILVKIHPERITQNDKKLVNNLNYDGVEFLCEKKILARLKKRTVFALMCIVMKTGWFFQYTFQKTFETSMKLLLVIEKKIHITCVSKSLTDLCFTKQRIKTKNTFAKVLYSVLVIIRYWQNIKKFVWSLMVNNL